jgi:hypothetical protein
MIMGMGKWIIDRPTDASRDIATHQFSLEGVTVIDPISRYNWIADTWYRSMLCLQVCVHRYGKCDSHVFSGFVLDIGADELLWVTAAHVLENVEAAIDRVPSGDLTISWIDGYPDRLAGAIPQPPDALKEACHFDRDADWGIVVLSKLCSENLRKKPDFLPADPVLWQPKMKGDPTAMYLVGSPSEKHSVIGAVEGADGPLLNCRSQMVALQIKEIAPEQIDNDEFCKRPSSRYFVIVDDERPSTHKVSDIDCMSGGPIVATYEDESGSENMCLVGIQSTWLRSQRVIRVVQIQAVVDFLRRVHPSIPMASGSVFR